MPPIRCELKWVDRFNARVSFEFSPSGEALRRWIEARGSAIGDQPAVLTFGSCWE
jgi:hypothetical protein